MLNKYYTFFSISKISCLKLQCQYIPFKEIYFVKRRCYWSTYRVIRLLFTTIYEKYKFRLCEAIYLPKIGNRTLKYFRNKCKRTYFSEDWLNKLKKNQIILFQIFWEVWMKREVNIKSIMYLKWIKYKTDYSETNIYVIFKIKQ